MLQTPSAHWKPWYCRRPYERFSGPEPLTIFINVGLCCPLHHLVCTRVQYERPAAKGIRYQSGSYSAGSDLALPFVRVCAIDCTPVAQIQHCDATCLEHRCHPIGLCLPYYLCRLHRRQLQIYQRLSAQQLVFHMFLPAVNDDRLDAFLILPRLVHDQS